MSTRNKIRYEIDLTGPRPATAPRGAVVVRKVTAADREELAELMLDAYVGTIDYDDECYEDALGEVRGYFGEEPLLAHSHLAEVEGRIASAVLVSLFNGQPFISYVMTLATHKSKGLATLVTATSIATLAGEGYQKVFLYITEGNEPSEAMFQRLGARRSTARV